MRHSVFIKFLAVFLCAASLLGAAGSAVGIFAVTELGLRSRTLEEAYREATSQTVDALANELAVRAAGRKLGSAGEDLLDQYYGNHWLQNTFDWTQVGFTVRDEEGNTVEVRTMEAESFDSEPITVEITEGRYLNVLNVLTQEEYEQLHYPVTEPTYATVPPETELAVNNQVPAEGSKVSYIHVYYSNGQFGDYEAVQGYLGLLSYATPTRLKFTVQSDYADVTRLLDDLEQRPVSMTFMDSNGEFVLDISAPDGVLDEFCRDPDNAYFILRDMDGAVQVPAGNVYDAIPPEGQHVTRCSVTYSDGWSESVGGSPDIGFLGYGEDGFPVFTANSLGILEYRDVPVISISFHDDRGNLVYEAGDSDGIGFFQEGETLVFRTRESIDAEVTPPAVDEGVYIYDDVPPGGYPVRKMDLWLEGRDTVLTVDGGGDGLGIADHDAEGNVTFTAEDWKDFVFSKPARVSYILMTDEDGRVLYEAYEAASAIGSGNPIGVFAYSEDGSLVFRRETPAAAAAEVLSDGAEETLPDSTEAPEDVSAAEEPPLETEETLEETAPVLAEETQPDVQEEPSAQPAVTEETEPETVPQDVTESTEESVPEIPEDADGAGEPDPTLEETVPSAAATDPYEIALAEDTLRVFGYYDHSAGQSMMVEYTYEQMPSYTVEITMGPGALAYRYEWVVMEQVYRIQDYLLPALVISLLLFAVTAVYLCCSAGRRPGTAEVRASGLNCICLDLYLVIAVGGVACCGLAIAEGGDYLLRQDVQTGVLFVTLAAYAACLLVVGFFFAFAAQVKTPNFYWWNNSLCARCLKLIAWLWRKFVAFCGWLWVFFDEKLEPALVRLFKALWKLTKFFCIQLKAATLWIADKVIRICRWSCENLIRGWRWLTARMNRFFSMLPLTWQFLLTGFCLVFLLYVMMRTYKVGYILLGFGIFFGVILYAASAFGILLESTKRMRKGDLDSKVDDKLLVGAFQDFADELNGLADVAVVAAQKQLKSERMKTELITNVSHDIKTPLTSIINYVDLMEKPHSPEEQQAYLEVLSRQSQRLKKLIDDLMEMSKASTGNMAVDITRVDAVETVNQALGEFADKLEKAQLTPVFRQPDKEISMMADGRLVWRVLSNLLSNAVKYALPGTRVYIDLMELEGKVVLSMKNISRDSLNINAEELLERFVRGDAARNTEGSGLGLNIAKSLMELQKGKLEILVDGDLFKVTLIFPGV